MGIVGRKIRYGWRVPSMEKEQIDIVTVVSLHENGMWVLYEDGELMYYQPLRNGMSDYSCFELIDEDGCRTGKL